MMDFKKDWPVWGASLVILIMIIYVLYGFSKQYTDYDEKNNIENRYK